MLTQDQKDRIVQAVHRAELTTSGEIVPMVIRRSDAYPGARWRVAVAVSLMAAFSLHLARPELDARWYLWCQFPGLALGYWLGSIARLQRFFMLDAVMDEEVHQRALQAFHELGLHSTRDHTGVLIMVSLLEHRVEIVADRGIAAQVGPEFWAETVSRLLGRIRAGDLTEGLCDAVAECGRLLAEKFPRKADDADEIPDRVVLED